MNENLTPSSKANYISKNDNLSTESYRFFEKNLLTDANLIKSQKEVLIFLSLIHIDGIIPLVSLNRRWTMSNVDSSVRLSKQLRKILNDLKKKEYIDYNKVGCKITAIKLNPRLLSPETRVYVKSEIPQNIKLTLSEIFAFGIYQAFSTIDFPSFSSFAKKVGIDPGSLSKYTVKLKEFGYLQQSKEKRNLHKVFITRISNKWVLKFRQPAKTQVNSPVNNMGRFSSQLINNILLNKTLKEIIRFKKSKERFNSFQDLCNSEKKAWQYQHLPISHLRILKSSVQKRLKGKDCFDRVHNLNKSFDYVISTLLQKNKHLIFKNDMAFVAYCAQVIKSFTVKSNNWKPFEKTKERIHPSSVGDILKNLSSRMKLKAC